MVKKKKPKKLTRRTIIGVILLVFLLIIIEMVFFTLGLTKGYIEGTIQANEVCLEQINDFADVCIESIAVISLNEIGICALEYNDTELMNFTKHLSKIWKEQTIGG